MQKTALEIFSGLASSYEGVLDMATLLQDRYWKRWVIDNARVRPGELVLDIGCGTCLLEERLEDTGGEVICLDLTEEMVRLGQAKRLSCVKALFVGDAEALPFASETVDVVVACYVPKYVGLPRFAGEVARVLRPGGRVVLYDFVRPRGPFFLLIEMYLHGALRAAGHLSGLVRSGAASTFTNLQWIVNGAVWNETIAEDFRERGVETLVDRTLSGGVVGAFSGRKISTELT